jgi:hypothetical protein
VTREPYHTALGQGRLEAAESVQAWRAGNNEAFVHDLLSGPLPDAYARADVLFSDVPWPAGFERFESRAGINGNHGTRVWSQLITTYVREARRLEIPLVFSTNRSKHWELPQPDAKLPSRLNGAHCALWTYGLDIQGGDVMNVLRELACRYDVVGDPMCGYGRTGRVFAQASKHFVMSDYNPYCIGYIAEHAPTWRP